MGDRIANLAGSLVFGGLVLMLLVVLAGAFLVILVLIFIFLRLLRVQPAEEGAEGPVQALGLFDAPATHWWADRYDQWLFRLEEALGINFSQTPARLFTGSMILAAISGSILAGAGYWLWGVEAVWPILIIAVLGNGLSAYWLGRPMSAMFEPFNDGGPAGLDGGMDAFIGEPLGWGE